jgi:hypothetical protein
MLFQLPDSVQLVYSTLLNARLTDTAVPLRLGTPQPAATCGTLSVASVLSAWHAAQQMASPRIFNSSEQLSIIAIFSNSVSQQPLHGIQFINVSSGTALLILLYKTET